MAVAAVEQIQLIDVGKLEIHPSNPRKQMGDLDELGASIRSAGLIEPIVAVQHNGKYQIVAGSRRLAAARKAKIESLPVRVMDLDQAQAMAAALIENLQRKDLEPLEQAEAFRGWLALTGKTQKELAEVVGLAASTVANALRLLDAAPAIQKALERGDITAAHARVAMSLPEKALSMVDLKKDVSVHELEDQAKDAQRSFSAVERMRQAVEKAEAAGKVVTWDTRGGDQELWIGSAHVNLQRAFGEPKKELAGIFERGYGVSRETHDVVCECEAVAISKGGNLVGACVSPTGWKKAEARARKNMGKASPAKRKKAKTAEDRKRELERDTKAAIAEATAALDGHKLGKWHPLKLNVAPTLLKGGIGTEPGRLALFGYVVQYSSGDNKSKTWEVQLWKKVAGMPLKVVREQLTKWAVAAAFERIDDTNRHKAYGTKGTPLGTNNATIIRGLVNAHYGVRAKAKAKAKKKAKRAPTPGKRAYAKAAK